MNDFILQLIEHLKYLGIFFGAFIEGPATALISGLLIKSQFLYFTPVLIIHALGDFLADTFYFSVGRFQNEKILNWLKKWNHFSDKSVEDFKKRFQRHHLKIIFTGKLTHFLGLPAIIGIGLSDYSWKKFLVFNLVATIIKSTILIILGYEFGNLLLKGESLVSTMASIILLSVIIIFFYFLFTKNDKKV